MRKTVTVLFTDIVDSTPLGERLDPESLQRVMRRFFEEMQAILEQHGGTVAQFSGDAVLGVFGIPTIHEDDALRAARAAIAMRDAMPALNAELERDWNVSLMTRTGINTGEVLAGDLLAGQPLVVGDAVNVAARLERIAAAGEILMGAETRRFVGDMVMAEELEPLPLRGKTDAVSAWRVMGVRGGAAPRWRVPMVGRRRELGLMQHAFERAAEGRACHLITVLGQPGVGKSRLVEEFASIVAPTARVLTGRCLPYGEGITFWPVTEVVQQAASITGSDPIADARRKIASLFDGEDANALGNVIAQTIGLGEQRFGRDQIFWAVRKLFHSLARKEPCVVVFDDIHWAEETFLDLVDHLTEATHDAAITLICVARDELLDTRPKWGGGKTNATTLALTPLNEVDASRLLDETVSGTTTEGARDRILELAGGNALYLEEMTASMIEDGSLVQVGGRWDLAGSATVIAPPSIQALLAARLDHLSNEERQTIGAASVIGKVFSADAVTDLLGEGPERPVGEILMGLDRRGLIQADEPDFREHESYSFGHILIRDAAYETLPKERRAHFHEVFGDWMVAELGHDEREFEEIIGYHYEQSYLYRTSLGTAADEELARKAFSRLEAAGIRAYERSDFRAADRLLVRACALLLAGDVARVRLLPRLGYLRYLQGRYDEAAKLLDEAIRLSIESAIPSIEFAARLEQARLGVSTNPTGSGPRVSRVASDAIEALSQDGEPAVLATALHLLSWTSANEGQFGRAEEQLERALRLAIRSRESSLEARCRKTLLDLMLYGPTPAPTIALRADDHLRWARMRSDLPLEGRALGALAFARAMEGGQGDVRSPLRMYERILEELSDPFLTALAGLVMGMTYRFLDDLETAEQLLSRSTHLFNTLEERYSIATSMGMLADLLAGSGRVEEARDLTEKVEEVADEADAMSQVDWRRVRARLLTREDPELAVKLAMGAVSIADRTDLLITRGEAHCDLGEVLAALGRTDEATGAFERGIAIHATKGNNAAARRAEARRRRLVG